MHPNLRFYPPIIKVDRFFDRNSESHLITVRLLEPLPTIKFLVYAKGIRESHCFDSIILVPLLILHSFCIYVIIFIL